jgi:hypothetical protein
MRQTKLYHISKIQLGTTSDGGESLVASKKCVLISITINQVQMEASCKDDFCRATLALSFDA